MSDDPYAEAREIKAAIQRARGPNRASDLRGRRLPRELRARAQKFARVRVEAGDTLKRIAVELGVVKDTIDDWLQLPAPRGRRVLSMRPVVVVPAQGDIEMPQLAGPAIVLANGVKIMGLSLAEITALVKELK